MKSKDSLSHAFFFAFWTGSACWMSLASANAPLPVCAPGATVTGVDVSSYQINTRWDQVHGSGRRFAFIKATEGTGFVNPHFRGDWPGSRAAGIIRGAYHYFVPTDDPVQQADFYLSAVGEPESGDLPPTLDLEESGGVSPDVLIARARLWLQRVQDSTGRVPIVYTNPGYWYQLGNPRGFDHYPLFIANYKASCPDIPSAWKKWTFWQQAIGNTPGISGPSDMDLFNGSFADLKAFVAGKTIHMTLPNTHAF